MHLLRENRGILWIEGFPEPQIPAENQPEGQEEEAADHVYPDDVDTAADPSQTNFHLWEWQFRFPGPGLLLSAVRAAASPEPAAL
ncbi:unnamed protein product [Linum trigynum]|uniref:Uncharacterized protein n=1 Tax=Linum trigynum TaxID=586398 RepID=A0AAV2GRI1_9ROSI